MKIRIFLITVIFTAAFSSIWADSYWEGAASMSRYGEFPVKGFYGASNSFPLNSIVEVTNPSGSKKVEIIIVNTLDDNNLFLLLSKDAAKKLAVTEDDIFTVKAKIVKQFKSEESTEKDLTDDPDFNPSTAFLVEETTNEPPTAALVEDKVEYVEKRDLRDEIIETLIISDIPYDDAEETASSEKTENIKEAEDKEIITIIAADEEIIVSEPPLEDTVSEEELFEKYDPDAVIITEDDKLPTEAAAEFEEKLVLIPAGPKPPEESDYIKNEIIAPYEAEKIEKPYTLSSDSKNNLESDSYYLQIGAFKDFLSADSLAKRIKIDYPVFLYKKGENSIYRVMAGPLKNDEKGAALYQVRIKGIRDAFIRKGE